jgi:hypothetical protein
MRTSTTPRRVIGDVAISAGGLLILLFTITAFDYHLRDHAATTAEVASLGHQVSNLSLVAAVAVVQFTRQQFADNAHLAVLTIAAAVLVVFLLRL